MTDPILYDTVDTLYHFVMDTMPQFLQDRPMASAFTLGSSVTYGIVRGLQMISTVVAFFRPNFHEKVLPILEKICITAMATGPVLYAFIDPDGAREIMTQHPVYTSGMAGVYLASITGAAQDLHNRSKQTPLEERLPEQ